MLSSKIPIPTDVDQVNPGSLVLVSDINAWAFGMHGGGLLMLQTFRPGNVNGKVADFGSGYQIDIDLETASRTSYPWPESETGAGDVIVFSENGVANAAIVLGRDVGNSPLYTFEMRTGRKLPRGSGDGEGLAYKAWRISVHCSDDGVRLEQIFVRK